MREVAEEFAASAQRLAPYESGALKASIEVRTVTRKRAIISAGGPSAPYAPAQEFGAKDHDITPRRARRLRFFWKNPPADFGPPGIYAFRKVSHPGNAPHPFFGPVIDTINLATRLRAAVIEAWNSGA
jgi:hypothetical protein